MTYPTILPRSARLITELVQVAAVAVAWIEKIDRDGLKGDTPGSV